MNNETTIWVLWSLWMLQAALSAYNIWSFRFFMRQQDRDAKNLDRADRGRAVVIVPIKGVGPLTDAFLESLANQDYPNYRLLFCFESDNDPAACALRERLSLEPSDVFHIPTSGSAGQGLHEIVVASAGKAYDCGQKVHNQRAAMRHIDPEDKLIAFADADMLCDTDWLSRLLAPLERGHCDLVGGYRWLVPESPSFATNLACVINASVATVGGRNCYNMLWGGSMALTRDVYDSMNVPELFNGSLNDDLHLAREARIAGYRIGYVRSLMIPSPVSFTASSFVEFARRQYYQVRHHSPKIYKASNFLLWLYPAGWTTSLIAALSGYPLAWIPWLLVNLVFDQARALGRTRLILDLFDEETSRKLRPTRLLEHFATPLWMTLHALLSTSALAMRRISWSGITYRIHDRQKTEILSRPDEAAR